MDLGDGKNREKRKELVNDVNVSPQNTFKDQCMVDFCSSTTDLVYLTFLLTIACFIMYYKTIPGISLFLFLSRMKMHSITSAFIYIIWIRQLKF